MKRKSLLFVLPALGMVLAGCTINPDYQKPGEEEHEEDPDEVIFTVEEEVTLGVTQTHKIAVEASGGSGSVTFVVSDGEEFISVDESGTITGLEKGEAVVTVSYNGQEKYCAVTVLGDEEIVHVEKIFVDSTSLSLKVGETHQIVTTFTPEEPTNKGLTYVSAKPEVCTVSAVGKVTAVSAGSTTVTVTSEDNPDAKKTISVTVLEPVVGEVLTPEEAIELMETAGEGVVVEGLRQVKGVCGSGATYDQQYKQYSGKFVGHDNFLITFTDTNNILAGESPDGMEITLEGYLEKYQGNYKMAYLPANVSPTGAKFTPNLIAANEVQHEGVLESITVSAEHREFTQGKPFVPETVTAHYEGGETATVTASFSGYDMSLAGDQTVSVSYTEGEVTVTTTYSIHVTEKSPVVGGAVYTFTNDKTQAQNMGEWTSDQFMTHVSVEGSEIITGMKDQSNAYIGANGGSGDATWNIWNCLKVGKSSGQGSITLLLDSTASFTSIKMSVIGSRDDGVLTVNDVTKDVTKKAVKGDLEPIELVYDIAGGISELVIKSKEAASNNYAISILSIEFVTGDTPTPPGPTKTLESISIEGSLTKTNYTVGEAYSVNGLSVKAHYTDSTSATVSTTITLDKTTAALDDTKVTASATFEGKTASKEFEVTVTGGGGSETGGTSTVLAFESKADPEGLTSSPAAGAFESANSARGAQWSNNEGLTITTSSSYTGVTKVVVICSTNANNDAYEVSCKVGGNEFGSAILMQKENNVELAFEDDAATGVVVVTFTLKGTKKSIYIKSLTVVTAD